MTEGLLWLGFWLFMAVLVYSDSMVFKSGKDSYLQYHKSDKEKEMQQAQIDAIKSGGKK